MESKVVSLLPLSAHLHALAVRLCELLSLSVVLLYLLLSHCTDWDSNVDFGYYCDDKT